MRQDLQKRLSEAADFGTVRDVAEEFVAAVRDGSYAAKGFPKSMYGVSKVRAAIRCDTMR